MGTIHIKGIKLYAFHGCLEEEAIIGGNYIVDVKIETDFTAAEKTDDLSATVDYVTVYEIVKQQMSIRSKLIEHAAKRIADALVINIVKVNSAEVSLTKLNPPMNGEVRQVTVISKSIR